MVASDLDSAVRAELLSLAKPVAETVARHLVATGLLIDEDPALALAHAMAARRLASRIAAVREAVGLAAYHSGEWQTAIAELRTYHRMTGLQSHLAVLADCERALGRPERAIDLFRGADRDKLDQAVAIELLIVAAGARGDLGQKDAAVAMLQVRELTGDSTEPWAARLRYAYADALLAVDRREEAREWFSRAADVDSEGETDAAERLLELDGVVIEGDDEPEDDADTSEASADDDDDDDDARLSGDGGDAARAGYRDRDAGDLADDELTDTEAGSLAAGTPAAADTTEEPAVEAEEPAAGTPADEVTQARAAGEGEAADRR
ncbi:Replicase polyprotein 1ab [Micromonospora aurantiaca (nom. illeg.)]|uniref:Replicase polyprotein 1ab n=1 Tax=Micromonospora aurantiaca (nom. illeg.) TaxID=47850 RepID=UPI003EBD8509